LLSPFEKKHHRATADLAQKRGEFVAALADAVFVAYAAPGGKRQNSVEGFVRGINRC
jgi:hypothetical protein